jgi:Short C-terminal domain
VEPFGGDRRLEVTLRRSGRPATADVSDAERTHGLRAAGVHTPTSETPTTTWRLRLQVKPDGETPFDADLTEAIPLGEEISVGQSMAVLFDPKDHSRVAIDHGSPRGSTNVEPGQSSGEARELSPPEPTALSGRRKSSGGGEPSDVPRGMLAHPSAGGPKLTDVSLAADDVARGEQAADRLAELADLRDRGALTPAEFEQKKREILGR